MEMFKFEKKQIEFLKKYYSDIPIAKEVLSCMKDGTFETDVDTMLDFIDFLEDESIKAMDKNYDATEKTLILEGMRDSIYYQTN